MGRVLVGALAVWVFLSAAALFAEEPFRIYSAAKISKPPVIDGKLIEECWKRAEKSAPFVAIYRAKVLAETRGMLCWDKKNLYVAFICDEPLMDTMKALVGRGVILGFEESVEVFIDGNCDRNTYIHFMLSVTGEKVTQRGMTPDALMDDLWSAAVSLNDDNWTVEMEIPLDMVGIRRPSEESLVGLNLNRTRTIHGETVFSCWSDTKGGFHTPAHFGRLIFVPYAEWLKANVEERVEKTKKEIEVLIKRYRKSTISFKDSLEDLEKAQEEFAQVLSSESPDTAEKFFPLYGRGDSLVASYEGLLSKVRLAIIANQFE